MLSRFFGSKSANGQTGIHRTAEGLAVAQIIGGTLGVPPTLAHCAYHKADADDAAAMHRAYRNLPNRKLSTVSVLPPSGYNLLLVQAPDVADDELRAAVRWRIKDLIDFHIDDAVIDVFQMPKQGRGGPNQMMYAVAARAEGVRSEVQQISDAGLSLDVIDILELSMRNIAGLLEEDGRGVALLYLGARIGVLLLVRQGVLYLARRIETGTEKLSDSAHSRTELVESLALEIRRSLDYFESHYEQNSIPVVYASGLESWDIDQLTQDLGVSVRNIEIASLFKTDIELSEFDQRMCLPAIGAALRNDSVTL